MVYYKSACTYEPLILKPGATSYLSQLRSSSSASNTITQKKETWTRQLAAVDTILCSVRKIDAHTLRSIIEAIRTKLAVG